MIHSIKGELILKKETYAIISVGSISFKVFLPNIVLSNLPSIGSEVNLFSYLYFREQSLELYGFNSIQELDIFERLIAIGGIGPKSALGILSIAKINQLIAAINEGKIDLLTRVSGVGKRTAERIVLELKGKLDVSSSSPQILSLMESDVELEETLISLGYTKNQAKTAISKIDSSITNFKDRLKEALKQTKNRQGIEN